jgi:hypothetical protein
MKNCPKCQKQYADETLNFCLSCGSGLVFYGQIAPTIVMPETRQTATPPIYNQPQNIRNLNQIPHVSQAPQAQKKRSNTWVWLVGIFTVLFLIGGLGVIGLIFLVANLPQTDKNEQKSILKPNDSRLNDNKKSDSPQNISQNDNLAKWKFDDPTVGKSLPVGNELEMNSIDNSHYFMLTTPDRGFRTEDATTKLTIRNVNNQSTNLGYGLLIHCDEYTPGKKDYAFLIDSKNGGYRIAKHKDTKETVIIPWTKSKSIKTGSDYNEIEVKDSKDSMEFYINGDLVTSVKHSDGNTNGIVGLYTGTGFPVSFSNLEIRK